MIQFSEWPGSVIGLTRRPLKAETTGSIPVRATKSPLSCLWGVTMRIVARLAFFSLLSATVLLGQANQKRIFLSPQSDITTTEIAEGFAKYCPDVAITQDAAKADYVLQAAETVSADKGTIYRLWRFRPTHERGTWDIVLLTNAGDDVLMATSPKMRWRKCKHHFEAVCEFAVKLSRQDLR